MGEMLKEIQSESNHVKEPCKLGRIRAELDPEDRTDLDAALDGDFTGRAIFRVLKKRGFDVSESVVMRHRRGECVCGTR